MTDTPITPPPMTPPPGAPAQKAELVPRLIARIIDGFLMIGLSIPVWILVGLSFVVNRGLGVAVLLLGILAVFVVSFYILGWGLGESGQTPGKRMQGLKVIDLTTGGPIGGGRGIARVVLDSIINQFCYINWIWAIFDPNNQTIADKALTANVVPGPQGGLMPIFPDGKPF